MRAAVIFDLDGVIIDSEDLQHRAYNAVLERFGVTVSRAEYGREWIAHGAGPEYAVRTYRLPLSPEELRALKDPIYSDILRRDVALMPGVPEALARLGAAFPLAVATNSRREDTLFVLDQFGLRSRFQAVVTREHYTRAKPAPDAFATAAEQLGVPVARCVVVEDTARGIAAAFAAGCPSIAVPHDFTRDNDFSRATRIVSGLDQVTTALIEQLVGG